MKILAICARIPSEGKKGDQVLSFHRLVYLSSRHNIQIVCFGHTEDDLVAKNRLESLGISVQMFRWSKLVAGFNVMRSLLDPGMPFQCALFQAGNFRSAVKVLLSQFKPDLVYGVTIRTLKNLVDYKGPLIVDMLDSMALNFSRRIDKAKGLKRFVLKVEYERVKEYEKSVAEMALCSFVVSRIDQQVIRNNKVKVIPLGINFKNFFKVFEWQKEAVVVFTGNMNYQPNAEAALWFYKNCWGDIRQVIPNAKLVIAGSNPTADVVSLRADKSVTVTGRVDSLAGIINAARVSVVPMQSGSGMQFKILEAMACGVPVVASTLGLGDIAAIDGQDILLADTPKAFTKAVISLLQSNERRNHIGDAGMEYVLKNHNWDVLNQNFEHALTGELE
jgi:glycosyltransferase involved in cell wall biosynthesis